jgi:uncharacterized protein with GYD domain
MPKYLALIHRTIEGRKAIKQGPERLAASTQLAAKFGCKLEQFYLTIGDYDQVAIVDAPDEMSIAAYKLAVEAIGAVKIADQRLFTTDEYRELVARI